MKDLAIAYAMRKRAGSGHQSSCNEGCVQPCEVHPQANIPQPKLEQPSGRVERAMASRSQSVERIAGEEPNEFDVMAEPMEDFSYTEANSGDAIGNSQESEDRKDIVSKIMKSRSKKDRMPNPA